MKERAGSSHSCTGEGAWASAQGLLLAVACGLTPPPATMDWTLPQLGLCPSALSCRIPLLTTILFPSIPPSPHIQSLTTASAVHGPCSLLRSTSPTAATTIHGAKLLLLAATAALVPLAPLWSPSRSATRPGPWECAGPGRGGQLPSLQHLPLPLREQKHQGHLPAYQAGYSPGNCPGEWHE